MREVGNKYGSIGNYREFYLILTVQSIKNIKGSSRDFDIFSIGISFEIKQTQLQSPY